MVLRIVDDSDSLDEIVDVEEPYAELPVLSAMLRKSISKNAL